MYKLLPDMSVSDEHVDDALRSEQGARGCKSDRSGVIPTDVSTAADTYVVPQKTHLLRDTVVDIRTELQ